MKMLVETILGFKGTWRVLSFLSQTPTKPVSRTNIKKYTYLGGEAINTSLKRLTLTNILIKLKKGKKEYYYYNLDNDFSKEILNMFKLENAKLRYIDYKTHMVLNEFTRKVLDKILNIEHMSVFGSFAKGMQRQDSDLDLVLVFDKRDVKSELLITDIVDSIKEQFDMKIEPHYFEKEDFMRNDSSLLKEIKNDEIVIFSII